MRVGVATNGTIENIIEVEDLQVAQEIFPIALVVDLEGTMIGIDWKIVDGEWIAPFVPPVEEVFPDLSPRQIRLGLISLGISSTQVEALIGSMPEPEKALIDWQYAQWYERNHPLVLGLMQAFALSKEQVDDVWRTSATL